MEEIVAGQVDLTKVPNMSVCSYGPPGSGKTYFYGSWPRPYFICALREHGYDTIRGIPQSAWHEKDRPPRAVTIVDSDEMITAINTKIIPGVKDDSIKTVVIDCGSFYFDSYFGKISSAFEKKVAEQKGSKNIYGLWEAYRSHTRLLQEKINNLPCNLVWIFHDQEKGEDNAKHGEIFVYGSAQTIIPAGCSYQLYHRRIRDKFEVHTKPVGIFTAKVRITVPTLTLDKVPSPLPEPTYKSLVRAIGYNIS